jgi:hypothetical protein
MPDPYPVGTSVQQVVQPIVGEVADVRFSADSMQFEYLVEYEVDGEPASRWFTHSQLQQGDQP